MPAFDGQKPQVEPVNPRAPLRSLLSSTPNTSAANPASDLGIMPSLRANVEAGMESDKSRPVRENHLEIVYILFGLIDDSSGVAWVPGKGPVPVDRGWTPISRRIAAPKRDLIAALAVNEITRAMDDEAARTKLSEAAVDAMRSAVDRIARMR